MVDLAAQVAVVHPVRDGLLKQLADQIPCKWLQRHRLPNDWAAQRQILSTFA
ncbi:MAG: hypothetical protein LUO80_12010 [Methylococcaceae bacterium]|jgi:hypothetical protein|nr:hypothetical protein [Methylococcaceae bacterium]